VFVLPADVAADARIAHVGVAVRDLAEAVAFYRDVLGLVPHLPEEADGATIVFAGQSLTRPAEIFSMKAGGGDVRALTDINGALFSQIEFSKPETVIAAATA